ncbi:MAG: hypothetical protein LKI18_05220 [Prevotella sp.]|jgi:hypothetical protein|nr:hypothetical protein [Prevotella sp.]
MEEENKKEEKKIAFEELKDRLKMAQVAVADLTRCSIDLENKRSIISHLIL